MNINNYTFSINIDYIFSKHLILSNTQLIGKKNNNINRNQ